ncbi:putative Uncharacterized membrane protein [Glarea lozoyensis 74030]|uniref:Putative Uncharacterized membrane protein n=1 Tax=Glarea lozoyensis (strain ATCC 74030 / MF5533) TaxID=1104152 RepID=H0EJK3_GLAL7|nr:putative Uncharacterized membrane protein [Glarea lozoyensis 74030]
MEGWKQTTNQSGSTNPFEVHGDADIGDARPQRLSDVPERPSNGEMSDPSSLQDVDLEAGEGGDWPLTNWSAIRARYREPLAECLATMVAVLVGLCLIAYGIYQPAILAYDATGGDIGAGGGSTIAVDLFTGGSARAFFTSPAKFAGAGTCFGSMHSFIVGLVVTVLTMAFGYMSGPCLNPARDFGPRVATAVVGYGSRVFTDRNVWWIYGAWGATISGGLVGGLLYDVAIFVGGESPVNYPKGKRKKAIKKSKRRWSGFRRYVTKQMKRGRYLMFFLMVLRNI